MRRSKLAIVLAASRDSNIVYEPPLLFGYSLVPYREGDHAAYIARSCLIGPCGQQSVAARQRLSVRRRRKTPCPRRPSAKAGGGYPLSLL